MCPVAARENFQKPSPLVASSTEGKFEAQDGYTLVNPDDPDDLSVEKAGRTHD